MILNNLFLSSKFVHQPDKTNFSHTFMCIKEPETQKTPFQVSYQQKIPTNYIKIRT